jgi:hypothetical protein
MTASVCALSYQSLTAAAGARVCLSELICVQPPSVSCCMQFTSSTLMSEDGVLIVRISVLVSVCFLRLCTVHCQKDKLCMAYTYILLRAS